MTNSEITTDRLAQIVALRKPPKTTIENLSEVVATQADENRRLAVENRILWDLLLFEVPEVEKYDPRIESEGPGHQDMPSTLPIPSGS